MPCPGPQELVGTKAHGDACLMRRRPVAVYRVIDEGELFGEQSLAPSTVLPPTGQAQTRSGRLEGTCSGATEALERRDRYVGGLVRRLATTAGVVALIVVIALIRSATRTGQPVRITLSHEAASRESTAGHRRLDRRSVVVPWQRRRHHPRPLQATERLHVTRRPTTVTLSLARSAPLPSPASPATEFGFER
jgi:hypothetical protein